MGDPKEVVIAAILKFTEEGVAKARPVIENTTKHTRKEAGNIRYDWYSDVKEPNTFVLIESFVSEEAFQIHFNSEYVQSGLEILKTLVSSEFEAHYLKSEYVTK